MHILSSCFKKISPPIALWCFLASFTVAGPAPAATVIQMDTKTLVHASQVILEGQVIAQQARRAGGRIYTDHTLSITTAIKGGVTQSTFLFSTLGGEIDDLGMVVPGEAQFQLQEKVIVFLSWISPDPMQVANIPAHFKPHYRVTGMAQGKKIFKSKTKLLAYKKTLIAIVANERIQNPALDLKIQLPVPVSTPSLIVAPSVQGP